MCVSQFRDYCNASKFQVDKKYGGDISMDDDYNDPNVEIRPNSYMEYKDENNKTYQALYYRTDLNALKKLAESGNQYAKEHLKKHKNK